MKDCSKCGVSKDDTEFYRFTKSPDGLQSRCKSCAAAIQKSNPKNNEYSETYRLKNLAKTRKKCRVYNARRRAEDPEKARSEAREYRRANKDRLNAASRARRLRNLERERAKDRAYRASHREEYKEYDKRASKKRLPKQRAYRRNRYRTDPQVKIKSSLRNRLRMVLKNDCAMKSASALELLGCSSAFLVAHLESKFKPGMTWENHGPVWHIDHRKPCAKFDLTDPKQQKACFHWTNLQPLFASENCSKRDRYEN